MIRRRLFRRSPRPLRRPPLLPRRPLIPPRARLALARANGLMDNGEFAEAAAVFGNLSEKAGRDGMPSQAAELALQASRAYFAADDVTTALDWARKGLRSLASAGRAERVSRVLPRVLNALREKGYDAEARQLELELGRALRKQGVSLDGARQRDSRPTAGETPNPDRTLAARCTGCGAPLLPDDVEWHDANTASCIYCGTVAKTT